MVVDLGDSMPLISQALANICYLELDVLSQIGREALCVGIDTADGTSMICDGLN